MILRAVLLVIAVLAIVGWCGVLLWEIEQKVREEQTSRQGRSDDGELLQ